MVFFSASTTNDENRNRVPRRWSRPPLPLNYALPLSGFHLRKKPRSLSSRRFSCEQEESSSSFRRSERPRFDSLSFFPSLSRLGSLALLPLLPLTPLSSCYLLSLPQATTSSNNNRDPRSASPDVAQRTAGLTKRRQSIEQHEQQQPPQLERNSGGSPRTVFGEGSGFFFSASEEVEGKER